MRPCLRDGFPMRLLVSFATAAYAMNVHEADILMTPTQLVRIAHNTAIGTTCGTRS